MTGEVVAHLIPNTSFLPFLVSVFEEAAPASNLFLVYGAGEAPTLPGSAAVRAIGSEDADLVDVVRILGESAVAIVHSMSTFSARALAAVPDTTLRVWSGWGGEYSGSRLNPMAHLLGRRTARLVRSRSNVVQRAERAYNSRFLDSLLRTAAASTDVFSAPVPTDFPVFRRRFPGFRGEYRQLNYASVEDTYATPPDRTTGRDILLGNSATPENNHLDLFALLATLDIGDRRIVTPLSYGDPSYATDIAQAGVEWFGDRFVPLLGFLPLEDYNRLLADCGVVVMGHRRQQALGNVARAIWQGAHVFLDRDSPILQYFTSVGLPARSLDHLRDGGIPDGTRPDRELARDRTTARSLWARDVVVDNIRSLIAGSQLRRP